MESKAEKALAILRLIVFVQYVAGVVIFPLLSRLFYLTGRKSPLSAENARIVGIALVLVGVVDYVISLFLERQGLQKARANRQIGGVATTGIMTGAFGTSLGVYGVILASFQATQYAIVLFGMCFLHGIHLLLRWQNYAETAREIDAES